LLSRLSAAAFTTAGNARWTLGLESNDEIAQAFAPYTLAPVATRITQPVLIMAGELAGR